jgi:polyisoprenoid-binding protein YceI
MKFICILFFFSLIKFCPAFAKEIWVLDEKISTIKFELPILLANNVEGEFKKIQGFVEIDLKEKKNNKGIFSVDISSLDMNYIKYKNLILSDIFFNVKKFPIALIDTKKFSYKNENTLELNAHLMIKGITNSVPLILQIIPLAEKLVQIKGKVEFSRTAFKLGGDKWNNTKILKDKASISVNLFLFKE